MSRKSVFLDTGKNLYVKVQAVMHPLIVGYDRLTLHKFPRRKDYYLTIDDAIQWCEKELQYNGSKDLMLSE